MKKSSKLTLTERDQIQILHDKGYSARQIASVLERSPNTIASELSRNTIKKGADAGKYVASKAQHKAYVKRKYAKFTKKKINDQPNLREFIIQKLEAHWNPDEIAGYLRLHPELGFYASKTAIYDWLRSSFGQQYCVFLYSKRYSVKRRVSKTGRIMIPNRVPLSERPLAANNRSKCGHFEQDAVLSSKKCQNTSCLSVLQDRKSRYYAATKLPDMKPKTHTDATIEHAEKRLIIHTITFDNGIENRDHERLGGIGIKTYFAEPYSPWQKGSIENANKMLRRYFPKGTNFAKISQTAIDAATNIINNKPRKVLGYKTALEVATQEGVLRAVS